MVILEVLVVVLVPVLEQEEKMEKAVRRNKVAVAVMVVQAVL